jgi:DNA polymerase-3 subunit gamma/tau
LLLPDPAVDPPFEPDPLPVVAPLLLPDPPFEPDPPIVLPLSLPDPAVDPPFEPDPPLEPDPPPELLWASAGVAPRASAQTLANNQPRRFCRMASLQGWSDPETP